MLPKEAVFIKVCNVLLKLLVALGSLRTTGSKRTQLGGTDHRLPLHYSQLSELLACTVTIPSILSVFLQAVCSCSSTQLPSRPNALAGT